MLQEPRRGAFGSVKFLSDQLERKREWPPYRKSSKSWRLASGEKKKAWSWSTRELTFSQILLEAEQSPSLFENMQQRQEQVVKLCFTSARSIVIGEDRHRWPVSLASVSRPSTEVNRAELEPSWFMWFSWFMQITEMDFELVRHPTHVAPHLPHLRYHTTIPMISYVTTPTCTDHLHVHVL